MCRFSLRYLPLTEVIVVQERLLQRKIIRSGSLRKTFSPDAFLPLICSEVLAKAWGGLQSHGEPSRSRSRYPRLCSRGGAFARGYPSQLRKFYGAQGL